MHVVILRDQCCMGHTSLSRCPNRVLQATHEATSQYLHTSNCRQMQADNVTCAHKAALPPEDNNRIQSCHKRQNCVVVCDTRLSQAMEGIYQNRICVWCTWGDNKSCLLLWSQKAEECTCFTQTY